MTNPPQMDREEVLTIELESLRQEHRALDESINALTEGALGNSLEMQRLKRRKLMLKDRIARLEDQLTPDIIA